jgi:hypothetical protein
LEKANLETRKYYFIGSRVESPNQSLSSCGSN